MKNTEKQGEHFCLHFLRGCAILLYTDECISPRAIVAQLDRAFGSDPEGQRFESSRSHQEKPEHIRVLVFLFSVRREDSNKAAARSAASKATARLCLACGCQPVGMSNKRTTVHLGKNRTVLKPVKHICVLVFLFFSAPGGFEQGGGAQRRKQSHSAALLSLRLPTCRNV